MNGKIIGAIIVGILFLIGALIGLLIATGVIGGDNPPPTPDKNNENKNNENKNTSTANNRPAATTQPAANNQPAASAGAGIPVIPARLYKKPDGGVMEFGGMYGYVDHSVSPNPATGAATCPGGFLESKVFGTHKLDYPATYCYKEIDDPDNWTPSEGSLEFGGMAGSYGSSENVNNLATDGWTCPDGFKMHRFLSSSATDNPAMYCYKKIPDVTKWKPGPKTQQFGGMYGHVNSGRVPNVSTGNSDCPPTFINKLIMGTASFDLPLGYCSKPWPSL